MYPVGIFFIIEGFDMRLNKISLAAFVLGGSVLLSACGGGNDSPLRPTTIANNDLTVAVTKDTVQAALGKSVTFTSGISDLGTTIPTTLTLSGSDLAKPDLSIKSGTFEAKGKMTYGSCIFTITESSYVPSAAFPKLQVGQTTEIKPCDFKLATSGLTGNGSSSEIPMIFVLGSNISGSVPLIGIINSTGPSSVTVSVNGVVVGTVSGTSSTGGAN
jgi:hypothetical protein